MAAPQYGAEHQRVRRAVLARDGYLCRWCGDPATTADHLVEVVNGGRSTLANMVAACVACNTGRGAMLGAARSRRHPARPGSLAPGSGRLRSV